MLYDSINYSVMCTERQLSKDTEDWHSREMLQGSQHLLEENKLPNFKTQSLRADTISAMLCNYNMEVIRLF